MSDNKADVRQDIDLPVTVYAEAEGQRARFIIYLPPGIWRTPIKSAESKYTGHNNESPALIYDSNMV